MRKRHQSKHWEIQEVRAISLIGPIGIVEYIFQFVLCLCVKKVEKLLLIWADGIRNGRHWLTPALILPSRFLLSIASKPKLGVFWTKQSFSFMFFLWDGKSSFTFPFRVSRDIARQIINESKLSLLELPLQSVEATRSRWFVGRLSSSSVATGNCRRLLPNSQRAKTRDLSASLPASSSAYSGVMDENEPDE